MKKIVGIFMVLTMIGMVIGLFYYDAGKNGNNDVLEVKGIVLETDDSDIIKGGVSKIGNQFLVVRILEGKHKGKEFQATNQLLGQLEYDSYYRPGDKLVVAVLEKDGQIIGVKALEHYRQDWLLVLFGVFVLCLLLYAGFVGLKALFSFVASLYILWNFLIPGLLDGKNPLMLVAFVLMMLSGVIIFSVAGFTRKGLAAFTGTLCGLFITIGLTVFFGEKLMLHGMTAPFVGTLLFSGYLHLDIRKIFYGAVLIGASGAAMDIAMDVAASMEEVKLKRPDIRMRELVQSGFNVGRAVIGTMTTTLLLAYAGGYLTLLMLFMTKNSSFIRIMNLKLVAAEVMRTVVGSIGLVLVAPITAVVGGWILSLNTEYFLPERRKKSVPEVRR